MNGEDVQRQTYGLLRVQQYGNISAHTRFAQGYQGYVVTCQETSAFITGKLHLHEKLNEVYTLKMHPKCTDISFKRPSYPIAPQVINGYEGCMVHAKDSEAYYCLLRFEYNEDGILKQHRLCQTPKTFYLS